MSAGSQPLQAELAIAMAGGSAPTPMARPASAAELERAQLLVAFTQLFRALRDPAMAALAHPPLPGATLPLGARVPGTSLELDPASAASCLGALLHAAPAPVDAALAPALAAADYAARRAHYEGREPPTLQALHLALARARVHARAAAATQADVDPWRAARVAGAFAAASLLGADDAACLAAAAAASRDGSPLAPGHHSGAPAVDVEACRAAGENAARALRHALAALDAAPCAASTARVRIEPPAAATPGIAPPAQVEADFEAAVVALFPARYVSGILATIADDAALRALPVDALLARLVRN